VFVLRGDVSARGESSKTAIAFTRDTARPRARDNLSGLGLNRYESYIDAITCVFRLNSIVTTG